MDNYNTVLLSTPLFTGFTPAGLNTLLQYLKPQIRLYQKGSVALLAGDDTAQIGFVLTGKLNAEKATAAGDMQQFSKLLPGGVFGDVLAGTRQKSPVTITAQENSSVLFLPVAPVLNPQKGAPPELTQFLQNMVANTGKKYFALAQRAEIMALPNLRAKIAEYLLLQAAENGRTFTVPFGRAGLAQYLNCERSALSREIAKMRKEGLIDCYKGSFKLLNL